MRRISSASAGLTLCSGSTEIGNALPVAGRPNAFVTAFTTVCGRKGCTMKVLEWFGNQLLTFLLLVIAALSKKIVERIQDGLNRANLRMKYFEEMTTNFSTYIFFAELYHERFEKNWGN